MLKLIITEAVVSKGYNDDPAVRYFSSNSENAGQVANFRIGKRVYDSKAEKNHRWLNFTIKAFGDMCERVKRMKLKEGSYINIIARYDEETWETKDTHETRTVWFCTWTRSSMPAAAMARRTDRPAPTARLPRVVAHRLRRVAPLCLSPSRRAIPKARLLRLPILCPEVLLGMRASAMREILSFKQLPIGAK